MEQDEKIKEAQEVLNWAIKNQSGSINCKVIEYKKGIYRVQFFTKENKLIMPVQVSEEWIRGSKPAEKIIHDKLKMILTNLEKQSQS
jgi:hypothetical protein